MFEFTYITQVWGTTVVAFALIATSFVHLIISLCFVEHLKCIQLRISQLTLEDFKMDELKGILKSHIDACLYFKMLNKVTTPILLTKFLNVAIFICILGFQLTEVRRREVDSQHSN